METGKNLVTFLAGDGEELDLWDIQLDGNSDFSDIASDKYEIFEGDNFKIYEAYKRGDEVVLDIIGEDGVMRRGVPAEGFVPRNPTMRRSYRIYLEN